ncbi:hypothetical protein A9975_12890 [Cupriavidus sp. UME77]|nr:hypothetical protein [Cupriavidus sp. UME77]
MIVLRALTVPGLMVGSVFTYFAVRGMLMLPPDADERPTDHWLVFPFADESGPSPSGVVAPERNI